MHILCNALRVFLGILVVALVGEKIFPYPIGIKINGVNTNLAYLPIFTYYE